MIRQGNNVKFELDRARCEGHGLCEEAAPNLLHLDDEGFPVFDVESPNEEQLVRAREAVRACPVAALKLI